ncbi:hypothetical protein [uncultured Amnibacterium sp.]|uniref:hypothetical protein n=1 Tax=uncultured Amnibacterium sp. TaxID=1631851 RepID=UPI0035CC0136
MSDADDEAVIAEIRGLLGSTVDQLVGAGARDEAVASFVPARRVLLVDRRASMQPLGRAWRLGVFLLHRDRVLRATGSITRAVEPGHPGHQAVSVERRREQRAAAYRAFPLGETVNFDAPVIELDADSLRSTDGPLFLREGRPVVRWNAALGDAAGRDLQPYLAEFAELLLHPPEGA